MLKTVAAPAADVQAEVADELSIALANTVVATLKAQNYHWNVTGMAFGPLHDLFQTIYEDHFAAQDTLAERMKALGCHVDGRFAQFLKEGAVKECGGKIAAEDMLRNLAKDQETLSASLLKLAKAAEEHGDDVTNDLAIERADAHDKFAWMLRAHLQG